MQLKRVILPALILAIAVAACFGGSKRAMRLKKEQLIENIKRMELPGLLMGEFPLARGAVVDGDTIKVTGLDATLRLTGIDTEETFKSESDRRLFEMGWEKYYEAKRGKSPKPAKMATPLGEEAKKFAEKFFEGVKTVWLERDHPKEIRDRYNRYLAYVFARKNGEWFNYNVECVRAGMSPYFTKYAYSRRFHGMFVQAESEARSKQLGIWDPRKMHYPDYEERLAWWNARAEFIGRFEYESAGKDNYVTLTNCDAMLRLEQLVGKEAKVLGTVGEIKVGESGPIRVMLSRRILADFPLIFFDRDVFGSSRIAQWQGEFVRVTGTVAAYYNKYKKTDELQIVVNLPGQVVTPDMVPVRPGSGMEERNERRRYAQKNEPVRIKDQEAESIVW